MPYHVIENTDILANNIDLSSYVNEVKVDAGLGTYPYMDATESVLLATEKLEAGEEIPTADLIPIDYEIATYRGNIPIALEVIDDAGVDMAKLLTENAKVADINTKNKEIIKLFKDATPKTVEGVQELTTLVNKGFKSAYRIKLYISASLYDLLDQDGLLNYDRDYVRFKNYEVIKLDDTDIGEAEGNLVGFVGDLKRYIFLFNRQEPLTLKRNNNPTNFFGESLTCSSRFDVRKGDANAGVYITYTEQSAG